MDHNPFMTVNMEEEGGGRQHFTLPVYHPPVSDAHIAGLRQITAATLVIFVSFCLLISYNSLIKELILFIFDILSPNHNRIFIFFF